jgi:pyridoxamine 5'-phosphate oxidase-like protein
MKPMLSLTDAALRAFLRRSLIVQVATLSPKKHPFVTPLWFVCDGGALYITTGPETWAGKNVTQTPEVQLLFSGEDEHSSDQVLRLRGMATCHHGLPSWRVLLRVAVKYYLSPGAASAELRNVRKWGLRRRYYGQVKGGFGYIRVVPTEGEFLPRPS